MFQSLAALLVVFELVGGLMAAGRTGNVSLELSQGLTHHSGDKFALGIDAVKQRWGGLIDLHCGGIPGDLVAARVWIESRGNPAAGAPAQNWKCSSGDVYGSELGLLQLSPCSREQYGITAAQAKDPETNVRLGCKLWNSWTNKFFSEVGGVSARGVWAWLVTAVGPGAARRLRKLADGYSLEKLLAVAGDAGVLTANRGYWGSQSPALVAWRVGVATSAAKASGSLGGGVVGGLVALGGGYLAVRYARAKGWI